MKTTTKSNAQIVLDLAQQLTNIIGSHICARLEIRQLPGCDLKFDLDVHGFENHKEGLEFFRLFGIQTKQKYVSGNFHTLNGQTPEGLNITAFCQGLPPTCHLEKYTERIPKAQTVTTDEFIEVERTRVVCDGDNKNITIPLPV